MRVAINCLSGAQPNNGARVYLVKLAQSLAKLNDLELVLLTARGEAQFLPEQVRGMAYEVDVPAARSYWQIVQGHAISQALRKSRVDVLHLPNTLPLAWTTIPTVITIFDVAELRVRRYGNLRTAYRWLMNLAGAHISRAVITISNSSKRDIAKYLLLEDEKITVSYLGVGEEFYAGSRDQAHAIMKRRFGIDQYFLLPGGIAPNKNIEGAIKAFAQFWKLKGMGSLIITGAGDGEYARSLRRLCRDLNLQDRVIWTGSLERNDLPVLYRAAEAVIYPSFYEGFGLPILEAMASGCPVIASNTSSLPEVAGEAALLVDPRDTVAMMDAMNSVLSDAGVAQSLIRRGLSRASEFSWSRTAEETYRVYAAAAEVHGRSTQAIETRRISHNPTPEIVRSDDSNFAA